MPHRLLCTRGRESTAVGHLSITEGLCGIARDNVSQLLFLVRNPDINLFQNAAIAEPRACFLKPFNLCSDLCYIFGREHSDKIVTLRAGAVSDGLTTFLTVGATLNAITGRGSSSTAENC